MTSSRNETPPVVGTRSCTHCDLLYIVRDRQFLLPRHSEQYRQKRHNKMRTHKKYFLKLVLGSVSLGKSLPPTNSGERRPSFSVYSCKSCSTERAVDAEPVHHSKEKVGLGGITTEGLFDDLSVLRLQTGFLRLRLMQRQVINNTVVSNDGGIFAIQTPVLSSLTIGPCSGVTERQRTPWFCS